MATSFLKWAGGKTRFATQLYACAPSKWSRLVEPFMGSAALFFAAEPERALLADLNEELVICFREVARDFKAVIELMQKMPNEKSFFLEVRKQDPKALSDVERAARVIYLNKTCFRGLWRVNKKGQFNTPYGAYDRPLYNSEVMKEAQALLKRATNVHQPFEETMAMASPEDWVYLDPPYIPAGGYADFNRYTPDQFRESDHLRLVECCHDLDRRGIPFLLTNTNNEAARELYADFRLYELATKRDIASSKAKARKSSDLVASNYRLPDDAPVRSVEASA